MKKMMLVFLAALFLSACGDSKEQVGLKEALIAKLNEDPDMKDYKLTPPEVAECVIHHISENAPGFPGDPRRDRFFQAYTQFIVAKSPSEAEKSMQEYKDLFGDDIKQTRQAALEVTDHIMGCMGAVIERRGEE